MASRLFCNGCGTGPLQPDDVHVTEVKTATLSGPKRELGLKTDRTTSGVLCGNCVGSAHDFVDDTEEDVNEIAFAVVAGVQTG